MASLEPKTWNSGFRGLTRRDRQPCLYSAYIPDPLIGRRIALDGDVAADVADAEAALVRFNTTAAALADTEALARLLLRAESVASSRIEGLQIGGRRLLRADAAQSMGVNPRDDTAIEILANINAMARGIDTVEAGSVLSMDTLLEVHRSLMAGSRMEEHGGRIREEQNWIGGSGYNPCSADFVPPPPEAVPGLMEDLLRFCNDDSLPALAQAAIAHAQFETIHPFADGNGRTGRTLIHLVLRRRGITPHFIPPVSLVLATWVNEYITGLRATRYIGPPNSDDAHEGINRWVMLFAGAALRSIEDAVSFEQEVRQLQASWAKKAGNPRSDSTVCRLIEVLPSAPVLTARTATELTGRTFQATNLAIARLVDAGVLAQVSVGRRNRAFEAPELIEAFTSLERQLASPGGDTCFFPPSRHVPARP